MKKFIFLLVVLGLSSVAFAQHSATLSWAQGTCSGGGTTCITGNNVYRGTASGTEVLLFTSSTAITSYTDTSVVANGTYYYEVTAVCATCSPSESLKSNEVKAVIPSDPQPAAPASLSVTTK